MDGITLNRPLTYPFALRLVFSLAVASVSGTLAWAGHAELLPLALILPAAWALAPCRLCAGAVAFVYHVAAARDVPQGAAIFFGTADVSGWFLVIGAGLLYALPFAALWSRSLAAWRGLMALLLVSLPPIGVFGWANPITAAGVLFPGARWLGLAAVIALFAALTRWPLLALPLPLIVIVIQVEPPTAPVGWVAHNTSFLMASGQQDYLADAQRQLSIIEDVYQSDAKVVVLPETIVGRWSDASIFLWGELAQHAQNEGQTVLFGAELANGTGYTNSVLRLDSEGAVPVYRQLMPVPVSMWKPWTDTGASPQWFEIQTAIIDGHRAAFLICYEQLMAWPPLVAMLGDPDVLVGVSNDWWARGTSIPGIQRSALIAWSRLFDTKLIFAVNE